MSISVTGLSHQHVSCYLNAHWASFFVSTSHSSFIFGHGVASLPKTDKPAMSRKIICLMVFFSTFHFSCNTISTQHSENKIPCCRYKPQNSSCCAAISESFLLYFQKRRFPLMTASSVLCDINYLTSVEISFGQNHDI